MLLVSNIEIVMFKLIMKKYIHILHDKGAVGVFLKGFVGYNSYPNWVELLIWISTLIFGLFESASYSKDFKDIDSELSGSLSKALEIDNFSGKNEISQLPA